MYSISKRSFGISREITFSHESSIFLKHPLTNLHESAFYKVDFVVALLFVKIFIFVFVGAGYGESILILSIFTNYESFYYFLVIWNLKLSVEKLTAIFIAMFLSNGGYAFILIYVLMNKRKSLWRESLSYNLGNHNLIC